MELRMKLVRRTGERQEYPLDAEVIHLGRERARVIPVDDPQVSRQHAEITCSGDRRKTQTWLITDLGSTNGTYVNDVQLAESRQLRVGDRIRVGSTLFTYEETEGAQRFRNVVAVLIALSTLVGALVAWRFSLAWDNAAAARGEGTGVLINLTQHQSEVNSTLYQNLDAFLSYRWHLVMAGLLADDAQRLDNDANAALLDEDRLRNANMALAALDVVNLDYVARSDEPTEQAFQEERFVETSIAEAASQEDLDYDSHFSESERESLIARRLTVAAVLLSLSIFCYTGATISVSRLKYVLATIGVLMFCLGGLAAALIEAAVRLG
jgi:hypothetical protein